MLLYDLFKMALRSLVANSMRTFLTGLGMIIGVASVISMISIGEGARDTKTKLGPLVELCSSCCINSNTDSECLG